MESGWNLWVWLMGVVSRRWVWLVSVVVRRYIIDILIIINPRRACAERVTVVILCVCVYVCLSRTPYSGSTRD